MKSVMNAFIDFYKYHRRVTKKIILIIYCYVRWSIVMYCKPVEAYWTKWKTDFRNQDFRVYSVFVCTLIFVVRFLNIFFPTFASFATKTSLYFVFWHPSCPLRPCVAYRVSWTPSECLLLFSTFSRKHFPKLQDAGFYKKIFVTLLLHSRILWSINLNPKEKRNVKVRDFELCTDKAMLRNSWSAQNHKWKSDEKNRGNKESKNNQDTMSRSCDARRKCHVLYFVIQVKIQGRKACGRWLISWLNDLRTWYELFTCDM